MRRPHPHLARFFRALALAALPLLVAACDTDAVAEVLFGGVELEATGDARLTVVGDQLVVSGLDGTREGGFRLPGTPSRVDVQIAPLRVPPGGRFGARVNDGAGDELASIYTEARTDGKLDFQFAFPDEYGLSAAIVRYRLGGRVVFEGEIDLSLFRGARAAGSGGTGEGDPGSTHVIRDRGKYIVVSDAEESEARRSGGCAGFLVTPPASFEVFEPICTDWVEIEPIFQEEMPEGRVSVTARGVGQFVVRDLEVSGGASAE